MADLSTLDPTQPPGTQAVSLGDDRIRETREAVLESFGGLGNAGSGGTQPEHWLNGVHRFLVVASGFRPAAGNNGRLFFDATNLRAEYDAGSAWNVLHTVSGHASTSIGTVALTSGYQNLTNVVTFNAGNDQYIFLLGYTRIIPSSVTPQAYSAKFIVNGTDMYPGAMVNGDAVGGGGPSDVGMWCWGAAFPLLTAGAQVAQFVGKVNTGLANATESAFIVIAF